MAVTINRPVNALSAARRLCERSGWTLSNLQLQKILYLAQMVYLGSNRSRLINDEFEAWAYGPVLPQVYAEAKIYGGGPIRDIFGAGIILDKSRAQVLDDAHDQLSNLSAGQLVSITHWENGAWAKYYRPNVRGIKIPDQAIIDEYNAREAAG